MTRREAAEKIFNYIKENKFKPINIKYGNGYFIFDHGEDGVVHFDIKSLRGWKFAMWIETDAEQLKNSEGEDYPAVQFFCRHKLDLDKFKPSRSFFIVKLSLDEIQREEPWGFWEIQNILQMIKRHPFVAFDMSYGQNYLCNESYIGAYLRVCKHTFTSNIREWINDILVQVWHGSKVWFINKYKVVDIVELIDSNRNGWKSYPRYDMRIHFKKISDDEEVQAKAEIKVLDRFFRKNYYKNMHLMITREGVEGHYFYDQK